MATTDWRIGAGASVASSEFRWRPASKCWALPGRVLRLQRAALSREAAGGARHRAELHVGETGAARGGSGGEEEEARHRIGGAGRDGDAGMLLHIDGSKHRWFQDDRYYDLIVILDDATSEIYYAQLVEEESTRTVMAGVREVIETQRVYSARSTATAAAISSYTPKAGEAVDKQRFDAVRAGAERVGYSDDCGLFAAGARTHASAVSGPGRDVYRRNCGWPGSQL